MLKTIRLHNFKTFLNAELNLTQRHLLIGRNNSGKTSFCAALNFLSATARGELALAAQVVPGGIGEIANWALSSPRIDLECVCELNFKGERLEFTYRLELALDADVSIPNVAPSLTVASEELTSVSLPYVKRRPVALLLSKNGKVHIYSEQSGESRSKLLPRSIPMPASATMLSKAYEGDADPRMDLFRKYLSTLSYFSLSPDKMRFGWQAPTTPASGLSRNGENLAGILFHTKTGDDKRYRRILELVRIVEPDLEALNFVLTPEQIAIPFVELRHQQRATWTGLSDGTLRFLGIAYIIETLDTYSTAANGPPPPLVIIEEPENGIYPGQMRRLFDLFEDRAANGQFLFTSHSPYFINFFDGARESVTILRRNNERTEFVTPPPAEEDPDRILLAEQYSMELIG